MRRMKPKYTTMVAAVSATAYRHRWAASACRASDEETAGAGIWRRLHLVGARSVHPGHRNVVQTQIHGELRPVVDDVVQHERSEHGDAGHGEQHVALPLERPGLHHLRIGGTGQRAARVFDVVVEG